MFRGQRTVLSNKLKLNQWRAPHGSVKTLLSLKIQEDFPQQPKKILGFIIFSFHTCTIDFNRQFVSFRSCFNRI